MLRNLMAILAGDINAVIGLTEFTITARILETQCNVEIIIPGIFSFPVIDAIIENNIYTQRIFFAATGPVAQAALVEVNDQSAAAFPAIFFG